MKMSVVTGQKEALRVAMKRSATKKSWLESAMKEADEFIEGDLENSLHATYERILNTLTRCLDEWKEAQIEAELLLNEAECEEESRKTCKFHRHVGRACDRLEDAWRNRVVGSCQSPPKKTVSSLRVNLPKLELPKFSGDVRGFLPFWQQFQVCVDEQDLPIIAKYSYLVAMLEGEARNVVMGLAITEENYEEAKRLLQERFGHKEVIVFSHIQELLYLAEPESSNVASLLPFYDKIVANVRSLETLGISKERRDHSDPGSNF